jgi:hypothetical protein
MRRIGRHTHKNIVDLGENEDYDSRHIADRGVYFSSDGQRRTEELLNVRHKKRRLGPSALNDVWAEWIPMAEEDLPDTISTPATALGKRKEYASTVGATHELRILY